MLFPRVRCFRGCCVKMVSLWEQRDEGHWASEASPTLGCSIEISRDICCRYVVCRMSVVCQINCVGGITCPTRMLKVFWGRLNQ